MIEKWKDIVGYENKYQVSNFGRLRNANGIMKPMTATNGYLVACLWKNNKQKKFVLHKLVAQAFLENPNNYKEVNHIDGNKNNNRVENLEWCDRSINLTHAYKTGLKQKKFGKDNHNSKRVKQTNILTGEIKVWDSLGDIQRTLGYSSGQISQVCNKIWKTAHNCKWEYV
jgi:hypothetical protein